MANTIEFICDRCAHCCKTHRVPITQADIARLRERNSRNTQGLEDWTELLSAEEVDIENEPESIALVREGRRLLVLKHRDGACVFLDRERGCTVHPFRPAACRAYPFDRSDERPGEILGLHPEFVCPPETQAGDMVGADARNPSAAGFLEAIATRDAESSDHALWLQGWNAEQRTRIRLRRLPLASDRLLRRLNERD